MGKYEEALERAKELHEVGNALTRLQMEVVFPELKESEDERIRRQIEQAMIERVCDMLTNYVFEDVTPKMIDHFRKRLEKESGCNQPKQEQPPLSSNLDGAARHSEILTYPMPGDGDIEKVMKVQEARIFHEIGFKAGSEWMAGQGVILNISIDELGCGAYNACVEQGLTSEDKVIIQIRKK